MLNKTPEKPVDISLFAKTLSQVLQYLTLLWDLKYLPDGYEE